MGTWSYRLCYCWRWYVYMHPARLTRPDTFMQFSSSCSDSSSCNSVHMWMDKAPQNNLESCCVTWASSVSNHACYLLCFVSAAPGRARICALDALHRRLVFKLLLVDLDLFACPDAHGRLPDHNDVVFRRTRRRPVLTFTGCPAEVSGSSSVTCIARSRPNMNKTDYETYHRGRKRAPEGHLPGRRVSARHRFAIGPKH